MKSNNIKPILFSTEMVQAILAGRKTQTRRIAPFDKFCTTPFQTGNGKWQEKFNNNQDPNKIFTNGFYVKTNYKSKYQIGDILWVRETWKVAAWNPEEDMMSFYYKASPGENFPMVQFNDSDRCDDLHLKTIEELDRLEVGEIDNEECTVTYKFPAGDNPMKWKPSLFMLKEASRIFLKVTNVRCERLQDINRGDAMSEGCPFANMAKEENPVDWFSGLWDSINAKQNPWKSNPWVWVYDFERIEKPSNFMEV